MLRRPFVAALALLALVAGVRARVASATEPADLVLQNAIIHTLDTRRPRAEAVAVRGNRIVAVGTSAEVARLAGPKTRVMDLRGHTVVPGFDDAHAHLLGIGFARLDVDLVGTATFDALVARVEKAVKARAPGEWIRGRGWHEEKWTAPARGAVRGFPTHGSLSAISPDNPVILERADGHAVLVNAKAMALFGITRGTRAPEGGEIIHDAAGEPTGVFVDNAERLVTPQERTPAELGRALELAMDECLEKGVTSLTDAGAPVELIALYKQAATAGKLRTRLYVMASGFPTMRALGMPESGLAGGLLNVRSVKLYADGALGSRGAALLEPYADDPDNLGLVRTPPEELLEAARFALAHGFQVGTHAIGDRANRIVLDVYQKAFAERPEANDPRFRIEHAQILDAADIPRFGRLGVLASMQGIHGPSDRPWAPKRLGDARVAEGAYVWRKLLDSGARIINGTDAPVEDVSPIQNFHASVTRSGADGQPPGGFDPDQRLTRAEALRTMTLDAAYGSFAEKEKGSIEVGKLADLVVLSQDILSVPAAALMKTEVLATILDGRVLYEKQTPEDRTRRRPGEGRKPEWPPPSIVEYKPHSRLIVPQHAVPRARFPVIDIHSHHATPIKPERLDEVVKAMDQLNLRVLVNLSGGSGDQLKQGLQALRTSPHADRMVLFANVEFKEVGPGFGVKAAAQLAEDVKAGALGLKIFKDLGLRIKKADGSRLKLDDPELDPLWESCARLDVPVLIHTAEPAPFFDPIDYANERWLELALYDDRRYQDPSFPRFEELIAERDRMFAKHRDTTFIGAHMLYHSNDLACLAQLLDRLPNVYPELAAVLAELGRQPRAARAFLTKYQDRVLFGKDSFQPDQFPYYWRTLESADEYFDYYRDYHAFWKLYGFELPDAVLKKLYYKNALKLVKGLPRAGFPE